MFLVGLTGGIATGKSTVSAIFKELGCPIIDADLVAREVVKPQKKAWKKIKAYFGDDVLFENGELDRGKLGEMIFSDPQKRKVLNSITHPEIYKNMVYQALGYFVRGHAYVILDLPLLFETGNMVPYMSKIIVVSCDGDKQLQRLMQRNDFTEDVAKTRISAQMALEAKCKRSTYIVENSGTIDETKRQVERIFHEINSSKLHWRFRIVLGSCICGVLGIGWFLINKSLSFP